MHRAENVDNKKVFTEILSALEEISNDSPIYLPLHPRTKKMANKFKLLNKLKKVFKSTDAYIYVFFNDAIPGLYKVGWTERTPLERAKELSTTGLPEPFKVAYDIKTNLTMEIEKKIHKNLNKYRPRGNREFFKADLKIIKEVIKSTLNDPKDYD